MIDGCAVGGTGLGGTRGLLLKTLSQQWRLLTIIGENEMPPRKRKVRPTYRQHSDAVTNADIQARISDHGPLWDYLTEIRLQEIHSITQSITNAEALINIGRALGMRDLAATLQQIVLGDFDEKKE